MKTCILAIQRYENIKDIEEWLMYHFSIGFDHIFLLDNNDENDMLKLQYDNLTILPANDIKVEVGDSTWQCKAYNRGFDYIRGLNIYDWIAVIDIDEFIELKRDRNIQDFIKYECINPGYNNIELKWKLFTDNNILYHKPEFDGNIQKTYTEYISPSPNDNDYNFYVHDSPTMWYFTKFIGKLLPELNYTISPHYPDKKLYEANVYKWRLCHENIAVLKHYKYKSLEDFISGKCKYRSYIKSINGSTWKYTRTYFSDNLVNINKIFHFALFDFKYDLNMIEWDIEYLHEALQDRCIGTRNIIYYIWFGSVKPLWNEISERCIKSIHNNSKGFYLQLFNEQNLDLDVCPYTRFMYDHKLYGICADFYKNLFLYYFGGIYLDTDIEVFDNLLPYYEKNDYMLFDASFNNFGPWFTSDNMISSSFMMSKPFNKIFKYFIEYCKEFTYEQLEDMYNSMSKKEFMDYFYDVKIYYYHIIKKYNYQVKVLNDIDEIVKSEDNTIYVYNNYLLESQKYINWKEDISNKKQLVKHYNIKLHEQVFQSI